MPDNVRFQCDVIHNKPYHLEFEHLNANVTGRGLAGRISLVVILAIYMQMLFVPDTAVTTLVASALILLIQLVGWVLGRTYSIGYKRMLTANMGQEQQINVYFCEDSIQLFDANGVLSGSFAYDQVRKVGESKNLYVLYFPYQLGLFLPKNSITGGSNREFLVFLSWKCRNWKARQPSRGTTGKVLQSVAIAMTVASLVLSICNLPSVRLFDKLGTLDGRLSNDLSYEEIALQLESLDIYISQEAIEEIEQYDLDYARQNGEEYYTGVAAGTKAFDLLCWEGSGVYAEGSWDWIPSTSGVYYVEAEVVNVDSIYTDFLTGLSAMHPELNFTNISEDYSAADLEAGTGTVAISFEWNGSVYELEALYDYDWFDFDILSEVSAIIAAGGHDHQLYGYYDMYGCLLYYGNEENVKALERLTGYTLDEPDSLWFFF